jgi:sulfur-carrier protein
MVQVVVPTMLAAQAEGRRRFELEAETAGDALRALPVADLIFNERGELNRHLNVYVDGTDVREQGGLERPLAEGAGEIRIVAMVSGG